MLIKKIAIALTKKWGTTSAKRSVWDAEYRRGRWTYERGGCNNESREPLYRLLEVHGQDASILDLGCGSGMTVLEMKNNFKEYVGVDISDAAIKTATIALSTEADRSSKVRFAVSDISTFVPDRKFSLILFRESIYYVPAHRIKPMLTRYREHLLPGGAIMVRLCNRRRYRNIIRILEGDFGGKEVFRADDSPMSIFLCSPDGRTPC
jgi:SAM-dependent methyltransferase